MTPLDLACGCRIYPPRLCPEHDAWTPDEDVVQSMIDALDYAYRSDAVFALKLMNREGLTVQVTK